MTNHHARPTSAVGRGGSFCGRAACGFGARRRSASLLSADGARAPRPIRSPPSRRLARPKAKSVIFLFMYGGPSHIDTFDYKPTMVGMDGKTIAVKTYGRGGHKNEGRIVEPRWKFKQYGQSRQVGERPLPAPRRLRRRHRVHAFDDGRIADPRLGDADDELRASCRAAARPSGQLGELRPGQRERKHAGLRGDARPHRRADQRRQELVERLHAGDATPGRCFGPRGSPINDLKLPEGRRGRCSATCSTRWRSSTNAHRATRLDQADLASRIASYELAYKMQEHAPEAVDLSQGERTHEEAATASTARRPPLRPALPAWPAG